MQASTKTSNFQLCKSNLKDSYCAGTADYTFKEKRGRNIFQKTEETCLEEVPVMCYKNVNYDNSASNSVSCLGSHNNQLETGKPRPVERSRKDIVQRPVKCPIKECAKMIATDSVLMHFYFDHSKVPRFPIHLQKKQLVFKTTDICSTSRCLALFLLDNQSMSTTKNKSNQINNSSSTISDQYKGYVPLVLMTAKFRENISEFETTKLKTTLTINVATQTSKGQVTRTLAKDELHTTKQDNTQSKNDKIAEKFDKNEFILFWVCQTEIEPYFYSITLIGADTKTSHSFTGKAIHIKETQDAASIYRRADGLLIRGQALNNLLDYQQQFQLVVNIFDD